MIPKIEMEFSHCSFKEKNGPLSYCWALQLGALKKKVYKKKSLTCVLYRRNVQLYAIKVVQ